MSESDTDPAAAAGGQEEARQAAGWAAAFGRVAGVLVAPGKTFQAIAARPTWVAPMLVLVLLSTVVGYMVTQRLDMAQALRHQNEVTGGRLTAEELDQRIEMVQKLQPFLALFQGLIAAPAFYLLVALLFWVGFRLLGSEITWTASLGTTLHGLMPLAVAAMLAIPVIWNRASITQEEARGAAFLASSLAAFAPDDASATTRALLGSVDLFSLWAIILLSIGYRTVARVSRAAAVGVVLSLWLLGVALKVGLIALFAR